MSKSIFYVLKTIVMITAMLSLIGCNFFSVESSKTEQATFIMKRNSRIYGLSIIMISSKKFGDIIWKLKTRLVPEQPPLKKIHYGKIPHTKMQLYPKDNKSPRKLIAGEIIELWVDFSYDSILALGPVSETYIGTFKYTKDGFFIKYKAPPE